jgi:plastocyanin
VLVAALSTDQKIGLALVGAAFIVFALASAFLLPTLRPDYPTRRGLPAFLTLTAALFVGMMFAVFFFGRESESRAEGGGGTTAAETTSPSESAVPPTTAPATTTVESATTQASTTQAATTTRAVQPRTVPVVEKDFSIEPNAKSYEPGQYVFDLKNDGPSPHDLVVKGPGVNDKRTPVINNGQTAQLKVRLEPGTYELYCSVPGHKQAGMDLKITVG